MALSTDLIVTLLGAIESDSLVFLCGAGLSIPMPSDLPSAVRVAEICYDKWQPIEVLDPAFRQDIDQLANHFYAKGDFVKVFVKTLVPWNKLVGRPNDGHATVADLLVSRGARAALSANFDPMIEQWANDRKVDLVGALTGQEAEDFSMKTGPLIKFHGCSRRDVDTTLWTKAQLREVPISARVKSCSDWMTLNLPGKHLVVVGFWTDWGYLNTVLADAFTIDTASSVTVIDLSSTADLETKAPDLWQKLTSLSSHFEHVQMSSDEALDQLRTEYSKTWARRFYALGAPLINAAGGSVPSTATPDTMSGDDLYCLRLDAEGIPYNHAATRKAPDQSAAQTALFHMLLLNAGADANGAWLNHSGKSIRIINGGGKLLDDVRATYREPSTVPQSDIVVCAGAVDYSVPARVIPSGIGSSTVRPAPGGISRWLTLDAAQAELGL